jgi:hypothetical protein
MVVNDNTQGLQGRDRGYLPVAGDGGDRAALIEEGHGGLNPAAGQLCFDPATRAFRTQ